MHLDRGRRLPRDRMELYRNALHTLVHDRDAERNVPSAVDGKLSLGDKLILLRDLAWRLSDNNRTEIDVTRAAGYVDARLRAMRHLDPMDGTQVLDHLRDRSGLLRAPALDRLDFVHRTFQEYLAAEEAAEEDRIGNLVGRAHLDVWRETIVMAAGHANRGQREELINGILDRAGTEPRHARALRLLAAACQETMPTVPEALAERLESAVGLLLPARRKTDPPALAAVGPSLLRQMPTSLEGLSDAAAVQTIRTVALIGGEGALRLLEGYCGDGRYVVADELVEVWGYFDAVTYVDRVLRRLPLADMAVVMTHPTHWEAVRHLSPLRSLLYHYPLDGVPDTTGHPYLTWLSIPMLQGAVDLSPLAANPTLESLFALGTDAAVDPRGLHELPRLHRLGVPVESLLPLAGSDVASRLTDLTLSRVGPGTDLSAVAACAALERLTLFPGERGGAVPAPEPGSAVASLPALRELRYSEVDVSGWLGTTPLPPGVKVLHLAYCTLPDDPAALTVPGVEVRVIA